MIDPRCSAASNLTLDNRRGHESDRKAARPGLLAFADQREGDGPLSRPMPKWKRLGVGKGLSLVDRGDAEEILSRFGRVGVDHGELAAELRREGALSFDKSWNDLMDTIAAKCKTLGRTTRTGGKQP